MKAIVICALCVLMCLGNLSGKTFTFDDYNFKVTVPDSWKLAKVEFTQFGSMGPGRDNPVITIQRMAIDPQINVDSSRFIKTAEDIINYDGRVHMIGHRYVMDKGYRCLDAAFSVMESPYMVHEYSSRTIVVDGYYYRITIIKTNADPTADPDLVAARDSFDFITPGKPPPETGLLYMCLHPAVEPNDTTAMVWETRVFAAFFDMLILGSFVSPVFLLLWAGMVFYYFFNRERYAAARAAEMEMEGSVPIEPAGPETSSAPSRPKPVTPPSPANSMDGAKSTVGPGVTRVPPMRSYPPGRQGGPSS